MFECRRGLNSRLLVFVMVSAPPPEASNRLASTRARRRASLAPQRIHWSTSEARRAGTKQANAAITSKNAAELASATGSRESISTQLDNTFPNAKLKMVPAATPVPTPNDADTNTDFSTSHAVPLAPSVSRSLSFSEPKRTESERLALDS